jgi:hypothetical protein
MVWLVLAAFVFLGQTVVAGLAVFPTPVLAGYEYISIPAY